MLHEHELWLAVILQAAEDLTGKDPRLRKFARAWFESTTRTPGAFLWICDYLELSASWFRRQLAEPSDLREAG